MEEEKKYPISEIFTSPQGEGVFAGVMMTFIRLAGCTVGKPFSKEERNDWAKESHVSLPIYITKCTTWDGREFACDTDYRVKERLTVQEILMRIPENIGHVCITGGEPLMHDLIPLVGELDKKWNVHVETSGTIALAHAFRREGPVRSYLEDNIWLTVSPKFRVLDEMLDAADEIKYLIDEQFNIANVPERLLKDERVFIQPINFEHQVKNENLKRCMELQKEHPQWRLSLQLHKILSDYVGERVR